MNPADTLTTLFDHHRWANLRLLDACAALSPEQLDATVPGTYGTIRATLQHLVLAEQGYFSRIRTGQRLRRAENAPPLTMTELAESLRTTGAGLIESAAKVRAEDRVEIDWDGTPVKMPTNILLVQSINHATEHRSQIMTILTQLGIEPPELDAWTYFEAQHRQAS